MTIQPPPVGGNETDLFEPARELNPEGEEQVGLMPAENVRDEIREMNDVAALQGRALQIFAQLVALQGKETRLDMANQAYAEQVRSLEEALDYEKQKGIDLDRDIQRQKRLLTDGQGARDEAIEGRKLAEQLLETTRLTLHRVREERNALQDSQGDSRLSAWAERFPKLMRWSKRLAWMHAKGMAAAKIAAVGILVTLLIIVLVSGLTGFGLAHYVDGRAFNRLAEIAHGTSELDTYTADEIGILVSHSDERGHRSAYLVRIDGQVAAAVVTTNNRSALYRKRDEHFEKISDLPAVILSYADLEKYGQIIQQQIVAQEK